MNPFGFEHGTAANRADFIVYGMAVVAMSTALLLHPPQGKPVLQPALVLGGLLAWPVAEYLLHRHVLHRVQPFRRWHAAHHRRPTALIGASTLLSAALIVAAVFLPASIVAGRWNALAVTLGFTSGYLAYTLTHHAIHHWATRWRWLETRRSFHALHHEQGGTRNYGVTNSTLDRLFGTAMR